MRCSTTTTFFTFKINPLISNHILPRDYQENQVMDEISPQSRQKKLYKMLAATATTAVNAVPMDPTPQTAYPVSFGYQQYQVL